MLNAMLSQTAQGRHLVVVTAQEGFSKCSERLLGTSGSRVPATVSTSDNHKPLLTLPSMARVRREDRGSEKPGASPTASPGTLSVHFTSALWLRFCFVLYLFMDKEKAWKEKMHL